MRLIFHFTFDSKSAIYKIQKIVETLSTPVVLGHSVAKDFDRWIPTDFILVAKSQMLQEDFRRNLPSRVSVGSVDEIMEIIGAAERSVPLVPLSTNPPDLNPLSGYTYFRLDQNAEAWAGIARHQSIAIHAQDVFEDLDMMLWAIRN